MSIERTGPGGQSQNVGNPPQNNAPHPIVPPTPTPLSQIGDSSAQRLSSQLDQLTAPSISTREASLLPPDIGPLKASSLPIYSPAQLSVRERVLDRASGKIGRLSRAWEIGAPNNGMREVESVRLGATKPPLIPFSMKQLDQLISTLTRDQTQNVDDRITSHVYAQAGRLAKPFVNLAAIAHTFFTSAPDEERGKLRELAFDYVATETPKFLDRKSDLAEAMILTMKRLSKWHARDPSACEHFLKNYQPNLEYNICETEFISKLQKYPGGFDPKRSADNISRQNTPASFDKMGAAKAAFALRQPVTDITLPAPNIPPSELAKYTSKLGLAYEIAVPSFKDTRMILEIESDDVTIRVPIDGTFDADRIIAENREEANGAAFNLVDPLFDKKFLDEQNKKYMAKLETCLNIIGEQPLNVSPQQRKAVFLACAKEIHTAMSDDEVGAVVARQLAASKRRFSSNARNDQPEEVILLDMN